MSITVENLFNPKRFFYLFRIELFNNLKTALLKDLIVAGAFLSLSIFSALMKSRTDVSGFLFISLFMGIIFTSVSFSVAHNREAGVFYFTLPASVEEKFLVKFLFTAIFSFFSSVLTLFLTSLLTGIIGSLFFGLSFTFFDPFKNSIFKIFLTYLYFHSIFFLGGILFKKNNFLKTVLSLVILFFIFTIVMSFLAVNIFSLLYNNFTGEFNASNFFDFFNYNSNALAVAFKIVFLYLVPPVLYIFSYLKFKKLENK